MAALSGAPPESSVSYREMTGAMRRAERVGLPPKPVWGAPRTPSRRGGKLSPADRGPGRARAPARPPPRGPPVGCPKGGPQGTLPFLTERPMRATRSSPWMVRWQHDLDKLRLTNLSISSYQSHSVRSFVWPPWASPFQGLYVVVSSGDQRLLTMIKDYRR